MKSRMTSCITFTDLDKTKQKDHALCDRRASISLTIDRNLVASLEVNARESVFALCASARRCAHDGDRAACTA